ncbi:MAG: hypothetical protein JJU00_05375 [Opitutales bacterium]|nr:hypothetical protein [Opitutales bacterium]
MKTSYKVIILWYMGHLKGERKAASVQEFLGQAHVETTMIYLHVMADLRERTVSPLDRLCA